MNKKSSFLLSFFSHFQLVISLYMMLVGFNLYGEESWYDNKLEGWYYFEDHSQIPRLKEPTINPSTPEEAAKFVELERKKLKALLALALIDPSQENVKNYIIRQRKWIQQSQIFSSSWKTAILHDPDLGDTLENPTSTYGIQARKEKEGLSKKHFLKGLSESHFLLFFFQGKDPFSQKAGEMMTLFAEENHWKIKAVSLDGEGIKSLSDFEIDQGISEVIGVKVAPSFFVVNPEENHVYPVGAGLLSLSELEENICFEFIRGRSDESLFLKHQEDL